MDNSAIIGIRDENLFYSALNQPKATFDGNFLYKNIFEMATVYLMGFVLDHPFVDGNKRVGLKTCLIFLKINGYKLLLSNDEAINLTLGCANKILKKEQILKIIKDNTA